MRLLALLIGLATVMALVFFALSILLINIVGWLWPATRESQSDRVVMIAGPRQIRQKEKAANVS
jgi:hypothetical protein